MVYIEEVEGPVRQALGAKFAAPAAAKGGEFGAFVIVGAGHEDANGCYAPTGKELFGAPVYENDHKCLLSREPHENSSTGKTSHGWVIGQDRKPLYGVETEALTPPQSGWLLFGGAGPSPKLKGMPSVSEAATFSATSWKDQGNAYFGAQKYHEAEAKWTRGLCLKDRCGDESVVVALYSNRAEARLRTKNYEKALEDAQSALARSAGHEKALLRGAVAARELKNYVLAQDLLQQCVDAHPRSQEAKQMLLDVEQLLHFASQSKGGDGKLKERWLSKSQEHGLPKAFATKDLNSKKGLKAFGGYGSARKAAAEAPPVSTLPYHFMGLPHEEVEKADALYAEMRGMKEAKERMRQKELEEYAELRQSYKVRAAEDAAMGKLVPLEELMPAVKAKEMAKLADAAADVALKPKALTALQVSQQQAEKVELRAADSSEIDALFGGFDAKAESAGVAAGAGTRRAALAKARSELGGRGKGKEELAKENTAKEKEEEGKKKAFKDSAAEALAKKLKEVVEGISVADLDSQGKALVEALKKFDGSKNAALLEEYKYLVV